VAEPVFLSLNEILEIHDDQIKRYGGSPGIRDFGLLDSAMSMPSSSFGDKYLHEDIKKSQYSARFVRVNPYNLAL